MSKTFYKLSSGNFYQDWSNTGLITTNDDWSNVPGIVGYRGDGMTSSTGVNPSNLTSDGTPTVNVIANQANPNTLSTGGVAEFQIADPVVALQGSGTAAAPSLVMYLDASGRQDLHFSVDLRDVDGSGDNAIQQVAVQYRIGDSGAWTNVPGGYVADASTGGSATQVTHLDLNLPAAVNNQSQVEIRVMTSNAVGSDEWIGIDNIAVTSNAISADHTPPTLTSTTPAELAIGVSPAANITLGFSELVAIGTGHITITDGVADTRVIDVTDTSQVTISGQNLIINPTANLNAGTDYHLSVDAGAVQDMAGNAYAGTADAVDFRTVDALTPIYTIQGAGHTSPYDGKLVNTRGVVTAIDTTGTKGFYIQDQAGDGNDATSDAIFVFSSTGATQVHVGDLVEVLGTVTEYQGNDTNNLTTTELSGVQSLTVISSGNSVAPTILGEGGRMIPTEVVEDDNFATFDPTHDAIDFYESIEGMLLTAKNVTALGTTYQNATFVVTDNGAHATGMNDRGALTASATDQNPERFELYADTGVNPNMTATYNAGDKIGDVTGVMSYYGGHWELIPTTTPNAAVTTTISRDQSTLQGDTAHLTVGAYNLENCDPNDPAWKFAAIGHDITSNMNAPDIMGVEEIQDNSGTLADGTMACDVTMQKIVDAIKAAGGPEYKWVVINPTAEGSTGGEPGGNIRTAILYNPARVSYVDGTAKLLDDTNLANGDAFYHSRKPLVADFSFHGETVTYVGIHNYSRLGSDAIFGQDQPPVNSGDARRIDQSTTVRDYVQGLIDADHNANVVVAGDFNAYHYERSLTLLEDNNLLHNLVWTLDPTDRYSSAFEGEDQQIDNMLVSTKLMDGVQFDDVHLNSNQIYGTTPSDHDPILGRMLVNTAPVAANDAVAATEDVQLSVDAAHGVLANDTDKNGDTLSVSLVTGASHGMLTLHADGSFDYLANANYNGADSFTYQAQDGFGGVSSTVTVNLDIAAVNDAPVALAESASVAEDAAVTIDVLANDTDVDGDALAVVLAGAKSALGASISVVNGKVVYVADADSFDLLATGASVQDSFTYQADDGHGGLSAPVTVNVTVTEAGDNVVVMGTNKSTSFIDTAGHDTTYNAGNGGDYANGADGADVLNGGNGVDVLFGGAGSDTLRGNNGADILAGGTGTNVATGGNGPDKFIVTVGEKLTITDFAANDKIITAYTGDGSQADLLAFANASHVGGAFAFADSDAGVVITGAALGDGSITLQGWTVASLSSLHGGWLF
ncbi:MAG: Ig-like domain-containing protein [Telluria sp.]